jgi:hypothetical protein
MTDTKRPFNFQALVRDYGWDVAERAAAEWQQATPQFQAWLKQLHAEQAEWEALLDNIEEYLDDHQDVDDGGYGLPRPNRAMTLLTDLVTLRKRRLLK